MEQEELLVARLPVPSPVRGQRCSWQVGGLLRSRRWPERSRMQEEQPLPLWSMRLTSRRSNAIPEPETIDEAISSQCAALGVSHEQFTAQLAEMTPLRRLPTLVEVANVAAFLASDQASAMTATVANLSCGFIPD